MDDIEEIYLPPRNQHQTVPISDDHLVPVKRNQRKKCFTICIGVCAAIAMANQQPLQRRQQQPLQRQQQQPLRHRRLQVRLQQQQRQQQPRLRQRLQHPQPQLPQHQQQHQLQQQRQPQQQQQKQQHQLQPLPPARHQLQQQAQQRQLQQLQQHQRHQQQHRRQQQEQLQPHQRLQRPQPQLLQLQQHQHRRHQEQPRLHQRLQHPQLRPPQHQQQPPPQHQQQPPQQHQPQLPPQQPQHQQQHQRHQQQPRPHQRLQLQQQPQHQQQPPQQHQPPLLPQQHQHQQPPPQQHQLQQPPQQPQHQQHQLQQPQDQQQLHQDVFMVKILVGDKVWSINDHNYKLVEDEIVLMMHNEPNQKAMFYTFQSVEGGQFSLTGSHNIPVFDTITNEIAMKRADSVTMQDRLIMFGKTVEISNISITVSQGFYAPLTLTGYLMVNNVSTSVFSSSYKLSSASLQLTFLPIRIYYHVTRWIYGNNYKPFLEIQEGLHPVPHFYKQQQVKIRFLLKLPKPFFSTIIIVIILHFIQKWTNISCAILLLWHVPSIHLLFTFYGLNSRSNNLIVIYFRFNSLNFQHISKLNFDIIGQQYLPLIIDHINSLYLSNDDETPQQTKWLMSYNFDLERFIQLQSLTLSTINCEETMNKLCYLSQLRCLNIIDCHFQSSYIDNIWFIPKLIRCELNTISNFDCSNVPTIKSFSLQYFSISNVPLTKFSIEHLLEFTPCLQHLIIYFFVFSPSENLTRTTSTIERLSLAFLNSSNKLENILQNMSNVSKLTVRTWRDISRNGYQWENLISNYLPKLKVFNLLMQFGSEDDDDINGEEQVDKILDSFQTHFWIDKHRWFVRCH
ncbi:unnamed protein product [Adineta steineri]|uniref:Hedgehog protein Hint domain-containing protein n=1 Tax=Adineta steineri TaxID=433720 RepID=A0A815IFW7_9BILA|nr:unnamed protein product [Adineta steineri]